MLVTSAVILLHVYWCRCCAILSAAEVAPELDAAIVPC